MTAFDVAGAHGERCKIWRSGVQCEFAHGHGGEHRILDRIGKLEADRGRLRGLLVEACEIAADLNESPNDAWRGAVERTSTRNRIEEMDAIARGIGGIP